MTAPTSVPTYKANPKHRNWSAGQSQWTIPLAAETACFDHAWTSGWCPSGKGWGLHLVGDTAEYLGVVEDHLTTVFVAKFVSDPGHATWHGYPADHQRKPQDIPIAEVCRLWLEGRVIRPATIRKLGKGQRCRL